MTRRSGYIAILLLSGCAAAPTEMHYFPEGRDPQSNLVWPGPPAVARLGYAGELVGEQNFRTVDGAEDGAALRVLRWIAGVAGANESTKQLLRPQSGMVDSLGRILVTDAGREAVVVFDETNARLAVWDQAEPGRGFLSPVGIIGDGAGGYLVADADIGYVVRLDGDGSPNGVFGRGILERPTGLSRDAVSHEIFVADSAAHDIKVFDEQGTLLRNARPPRSSGRRVQRTDTPEFRTRSPVRDRYAERARAGAVTGR